MGRGSAAGILFVLVTATVWAETPPRPAPKPPNLIVEARLSAELPRAASCGTFHFAVVMRYEVLRVLSGSYPAKVLYATHGCPEMPRSMYGGAEAGTLAHFRIGDVHRLALQTRRPPDRHVSYINPFPEAAGAHPWVLRAD